jgi:hypothetical protein
MAAAQELRDASASPPEGAGRLYGVIDSIRPTRIAGWAIDRGDAAADVEIDVLRDGRRIATVRADRMRRDLEANGLGTGRYGFACLLEPPLEPGFEFTISAMARSLDGETAELKRAGSAASADDPSRRLLESLHQQLRAMQRGTDAARAEELARLETLLARIEVVQTRLEHALDATAPPNGGLGAGAMALVALSLAAGLVSLGIGLFSLFAG